MELFVKQKKYLKTDVLVSLYYSFIYPHITYCIPVWGCSNANVLHPIIIHQKKAVRCISHVSKNQKKPSRVNSQVVIRASTAPIFSKLSLLNVLNIYKYEVSLFMFKYKINELPDFFMTWFTKKTGVHKHVTRNYFNDYLVPYYKTSIGQSSMKYQGVVIWNSLDKEHKKMLCTYSNFKKTIKTKLLKEQKL